MTRLALNNCSQSVLGDPCSTSRYELDNNCFAYDFPFKFAARTYRNRLIKSTVWVEVGKIFFRRGDVKHPYDRTPQ